MVFEGPSQPEGKIDENKVFSSLVTEAIKFTREKRQRMRSHARNETINRNMEKIRDKVFVAWTEKNEKKKITWKQQITSKRFLQA